MRVSLAKTFLPGLAALALVCSVVAGAQQPPAADFTPSDEQPEDLPEGAGRDETFYACTPCHNFKLVSQQGMTRPQWEDTLAFMTARHNMPAIEGDDRTLILGYLEKHYPPKPARAGGWRNPFQP